jgi:CRISPR-associated endonuclease/helicase Cas3
MVISHLFFDENSKQWHIQSNDEHQRGVALLAECFGREFNCGELCRILGELHDKGKEQSDFQNYIKFRLGYDLTIKNVTHPNHAYIGALLARKLFTGFGYVAGLIISSHHSGLKDAMDYNETLKGVIPPDISEPHVSNPNISLSGIQVARGSEHHLIRMMYSCLVDADFLDTETFMNGKPRKEIIGKQNTIPELLEMLEIYLKRFDDVPKSELNNIRSQIQKLCRDSADSPKGIYSLTVPTGGGKTLSGLLWALTHAARHGLNRVIIAIPYTSIIVQTATILRNIFGAANVLEHHSAFDAELIEDGAESEFALKQRLASENWDYPIIVTTNVQLFQSMMASKSSRCRKLHNIVNSVIILDEAQMLPIQHLQPIVDSLNTYQHLFGCSILLTTASQPVLMQKYIEQVTRKFKGLDNVTEIISATMNLHNRLRRVQLHFIEKCLDYDDVASMVLEHRQVLCVVNTRRDAFEIFSRLPHDDVKNIHLSRTMCSEHLSKKIAEIQAMLKDGEPIRVISTQLIEAGVDIDFETVMRQEAGLDSILQSAGRCNREGKRPVGDTYVFSLNRRLPNGIIRIGNNARQALLSDKEIDWFAPATMTEYFRQLYSRCNNFDISDIKTKLYYVREMQFETAAKEFKLIEDNGIDVIVNYGESPQLVNELRHTGPCYRLKKKLSRFTVSIRQCDFNELRKSGIIDEVLPDIFYVADAKQYDSQSGLSITNHWLNEIHII